MPSDVVLIGYCPAHRLDELDPNAVETLRRLRCEIRGFDALGKFDPDYPHGNKLLATLEPKDTDFSAFLDSDMLFVRDCAPEDITSKGQIGVVPSTSMRWTGQEIWDVAYGAFDMPVPEERMRLMRDRRQAVAPYFNAGLVVIDERLRNEQGQRFAEVWMDTAQQSDAVEELPGKRPYLDQVSLPIAIQRAGTSWNILHERYNFSIGGILRGKKIDPEAQDVTLLHYRRGTVLSESGLRDHARKALATQAGTRRINWIFLNPPPPGISPPENPPVAAPKTPASKTTPEPAPPPAVKLVEPAPPPPIKEVERPPGAGLPDISKATVGAVTFDEGNSDALRRWITEQEALCGRENIYVFTERVAQVREAFGPEINLLMLPKTETPRTLNQDWQGVSNFVSGLTLYYNWIVCTRVYEVLCLAPKVQGSLMEHLMRVSTVESPPRFLVPLPFRPVQDLDNKVAQLALAPDRARPSFVRRRVQYRDGGAVASPRDVMHDKDVLLIDLSPAELPPRETGMAQPFDVDLIHKRLSEIRTRAPRGGWQYTEIEPLLRFYTPVNLAQLAPYEND